jgi:hypothetical protein
MKIPIMNNRIKMRIISWRLISPDKGEHGKQGVTHCVAFSVIPSIFINGHSFGFGFSSAIFINISCNLIDVMRSIIDIINKTIPTFFSSRINAINDPARQ